MMRLISSARMSIAICLRWNRKERLALQGAAEVLELGAERAVVDGAPHLRDDAAEDGGVDGALDEDLLLGGGRELLGDGGDGGVVERHGAGDAGAQPSQLGVGQLAEGGGD